ncbi:MAG TPA: apolipoprotein N-acyltransferase [Xanthobacteraceae bacterium]|nr:apolipoprotein N-acyltransferase [Xanthobacteraceae bacterium]
MDQTVMLVRLAHSVVLAWGWRRAGIACLAGAASTLALAPFNAWPILFVTFPIAVWLIDGSGAGRFNGAVTAAMSGWCFGFGYFVAGLYWIGIAFLVDADTFAWLIPFAVIGLPAFLALYTGFGFALARWLWTRGAMRVVTLALALTGAEWLRGHLVTGFPWNAFGYALTGPLALAQSSALFGIWGLTFLAVLIFASPAVLADDAKETPHRWFLLAAGLMLLIALAGYGTWRLGQAQTAFVPNVRLRIMQPNLPQDDKFNYAAKSQVMRRYLALSDRATGPEAAGMKDVTHLIWPESAFPFFLAREADALAQIAALLPNGAVLVTGAARPATLAPAGSGVRAHNSVYIIDHTGALVSVYDKVHLVPFGEYLPFQDFLESLGLMQLTKVQGGFVPGDRHRAMPVPHAPAFLPLICYEIVFPDEVPRGERPGWLLNLTNDGWFGNSVGPYQHLQQARIRAIEHGLPLVRAANTGVSAVIDPYGRIVKSLSLGSEGVIDASLPKAIEPPFYVRFGDTPIALSLAMLAFIVVRRGWRRDR